MKFSFQILEKFLFFAIQLCLVQSIFAEDFQNPNAATSSNPPNANATMDPQQQMLASLGEKLTTTDGTPVRITVLPPVDLTGANLGEMAARGLVDSLGAFGVSNTQIVPYTLETMTQEDLQVAAYQLQTDIIIVSILTQYQFELFIFDSAEPEKIFTSNQPVPDPRANQYTMQAIQYYSDLLVSRTLSLYANGYFYELPSKHSDQGAIDLAQLPAEAQSIRDAQIELPRDLASIESEPELPMDRTQLYISPAAGGVSAKGNDGQAWNHYIFSLQFGHTLWENIFLEAGLDHFDYNSINVGGRYFFPTNGDMQFNVGLGVAKIFDRSEYEGTTTGYPVDPTPLRQQSGIYAMPSVGMTFPFLGTRMKLELKAFVGSNGRTIIAFLPGLMTSF